MKLTFSVFGHLYLTCLVESRTLCSHFASIMGRIHFDFERTDGNFLIKTKCEKIHKKKTDKYKYISLSST